MREIMDADARRRWRGRGVVVFGELFLWSSAVAGPYPMSTTGGGMVVVSRSSRRRKARTRELGDSTGVGVELLLFSSLSEDTFGTEGVVG